MTMHSDTYEIHYKTRGEDLRFTESDHLIFNVWRDQKDTKREIERIKAIARALACADEDFSMVRLMKKTEEKEEVAF